MTRNNFRSFALFGLLTGLISGIWVISSFTIVGCLNSAFHLGIPAARIRAYSGLLSIIILLLGIVLGMRDACRKNGGQISYGMAVRTGLVIAVLTGLVVSAFSLLYCTVINPGYSTYMVHEAESAMVAAHARPESIGPEHDKVRREFSTSSQVLMALVGQIVVGTIGSLILGLFISRNSAKHRMRS
jgi:hypothetical protein